MLSSVAHISCTSIASPCPNARCMSCVIWSRLLCSVPKKHEATLQNTTCGISVTKWIFDTFGLRMDILTNAKVFRGTLVVTDIWKEIGWSSIIYLATITGIDQQLYEAACVDGATKLQQIWHVTIPGLIPTIMTMLLLRVGHILDAGFEQILVMQNSLVWDVSEILDTFSYSLAFESGKHAQAAVVGCVKSVIGLVLVLTTNSIAKHYDQEVL